MDREDPTGKELLEDLVLLVRRGVRGPEDVIKAAPRLLTRVRATGGEWAEAMAVVRLLNAATHALGHPRGSALRALLALDPVPSRGRVSLTLTDRRGDAAVYYDVFGDSFRKDYERHLLLALAIEMQQRLRRGDDTTHAVPDKAHPIFTTLPGPANPPPPASAFKAARHKPVTPSTGE
ncbi:hypothetical protein [Frankia sp. R82]|uniref:hypothetical protein n=1 Tax=Frankia sp. R82 TaxID=2950553 RepID=UPI002043BB9E|nr:hypothetical protein [Frankia sp. R82]MCM3882145.1 hypothetical protein [Frankia sp. R82]